MPVSCGNRTRDKKKNITSAATSAHLWKIELCEVRSMKYYNLIALNYNFLIYKIPFINMFKIWKQNIIGNGDFNKLYW